MNGTTGRGALGAKGVNFVLCLTVLQLSRKSSLQAAKRRSRVSSCVRTLDDDGIWRADYLLGL